MQLLFNDEVFVVDPPGQMSKYDTKCNRYDMIQGSFLTKIPFEQQLRQQQ